MRVTGAHEASVPSSLKWANALQLLPELREIPAGYIAHTSEAFGKSFQMAGELGVLFCFVV